MNTLDLEDALRSLLLDDIICARKLAIDESHNNSILAVKNVRTLLNISLELSKEIIFNIDLVTRIKVNQ